MVTPRLVPIATSNASAAVSFSKDTFPSSVFTSILNRILGPPIEGAPLRAPLQLSYFIRRLNLFIDLPTNSLACTKWSGRQVLRVIADPRRLTAPRTPGLPNRPTIPDGFKQAPFGYPTATNRSRLERLREDQTPIHQQRGSISCQTSIDPLTR